MQVSVIAIGAHLVIQHELSIGALIAFQMLAGRVTSPLVQIISLIHEYQETSLSVRLLAQIMDTDPYFWSQNNGAGAPIHFATTYKQLDMARCFACCLERRFTSLRSDTASRPAAAAPHHPQLSGHGEPAGRPRLHGAAPRGSPGAPRWVHGDLRVPAGALTAPRVAAMAIVRATER
jgi:ABC-type multidrug transport system fused ATPase/permease subunit